MEEKRVLKPAEVAQQLRCSRKTVYSMLHKGLIPHIKVGDMYLIPVSSFNQYLSNAVCQLDK